MNSNILIVDDDAAIREAMHEFIELAGFSVFTASSGEEALELLKPNNISVVITDMMMPGMNGLELTGLIKKNYDTDVIIMTGYSDKYSYEQAISKGASDIIFKPMHFKELLLRLKRVLKERQLKKERSTMLKNLEELAITDELTQLYNSRHFFKQLDMEVYRSKRYEHPLSLLFLDVDRFKKYNDAYGHLQGDKVLIRLSRIIKSCLRTMDSAYRYGGEEFTVILPETQGKEALIVAARIKALMEAEKFTPEPGKIVKVTISIGVTEYCPDESVSNFVERADKAMYIAKQEGRNRVASLNCEFRD
ncbi:MAG: diguanylate cyclase [Thermodesulfobacteriota bacterium]|nr:diguanylate cyclase [Thermodesulfobacteriota bacterium]